MTERQPTPTDWTALRHPLFWGALALLVVNDHLLKGSGLLPGWLTGKLSDFAGLIVAPIALGALLGRLLGARTRHARAFAFALVGGWFAGANLFAPVAAATSALGAWLGLSWRFWVDPTDLVALAAMPVAWRLGQPGRAPAGALTERLALGLALAACVASPPPEPFWNTAAFLYNATDEDLELHVRWVEADLDCEAMRASFADALPREVFGAGTTFAVRAQSTLPLDRGVALGVGRDRPAPTVTHSGNCDAILVRGGGVPETLIFWSELGVRVIPADVEDDADRAAVAGGLHLVGGRDGAPIALVSAAGYLHAVPVDVYDGGASCRDYGEVRGFDWSELPRWVEQPLRIDAIRPTIDGCLLLELVERRSGWGEDGAAHEVFLCVPPEDFPFHQNAEVRITSDEADLRIVRDLEREDGTSWRTGELRVVRARGLFFEGPFRAQLTTVDPTCRGERLACGGFRLPGAVGLAMDGTTRYVHPGELVERVAADGRRARLRVGRAESMSVTRAACGAARDQLGARMDILVSYGEEPR
ncbi:MAG: hypothetical protein KF729_11020 [Sandaracinaceae bacterium]|nr:hypothetical protein [Sandaracinaceae bacterium]